MRYSGALALRALPFCTLASTASISSISPSLIGSLAANLTTPDNSTTAYTLPPDPYIYRSAHPLIITFHSYGAPLWTYSVEHVILDAVLDAVEHDDHEAINVTTLRYEDVHSRTESAALEMFFRSPMTWDGWSVVVDALQKVFKGVYVNLVYEVAVALTPGKLRYIGPGRLYNPKDA